MPGPRLCRAVTFAQVVRLRPFDRHSTRLDETEPLVAVPQASGAVLGLWR